MGKTKKRGNGEGSYFYNEKRKCWIGQKVFGTKADGKPNRITRYGKTKKQCQEKIAKYELEYKNGVCIESSKITVHDIIKMQIDDDFKSNLINANSYTRRNDTLNIIDNYGLGAVRIQKLNETTLKKFFQSITIYSNSCIKKVYNAVKKCCTYAVKKKLIAENPFDDIIRPNSDKSDKKISSLTIDEQKKFIDVLNNQEINNRYRYQYLIMLCTGMRMGEINALTLKDINFTFKTININKTISKDEKDRPILGEQTKTDAGMRLIEMTGTVYNLLQEYINTKYVDNKEQLLFYDEQHCYVSTNQVNSNFKRLIVKYSIIPTYTEFRPLSEKRRKKIAYKKYSYYKITPDGYKALPKDAPKDWETNFGNYYYKAILADKEYNQHMLRHTFATRCIENGVDYKTLSEILGHSDISITLNTYCDVIGQFKKEQFSKIEKSQQQFNILGTAVDCNNDCSKKAF